ncbi:MAG: phosphopantetheine-binding protein [Clostridia bacterium]|nr:phosphopantetheine-binding protein [Clostridia bacterium]
MKEKIILDITDFIKKEIINNSETDIGPDENIISKGLIDSMGIIRLMSFIQEAYNIKEINNKDMLLDNFQTVDKIADLVSKYIQN